MPYRFSKLIAECGWNVVAARVGQWAGEGAAAFYVTHHDGRPVSPEEIERGLGRRVAPG
jgi:[protein-PII] uridylyltransferase